MLNLDECVEILAGACHLQMRTAIELCSNFLESELCAKTCVDILNISETFALSKVNIVHVKGQNFILDPYNGNSAPFRVDYIHHSISSSS